MVGPDGRALPLKRANYFIPRTPVPFAQKYAQIPQRKLHKPTTVPHHTKLVQNRMSAECPYGLPIYGAPHMATRRHCTPADMNSHAKSPRHLPTLRLRYALTRRWHWMSEAYIFTTILTPPRVYSHIVEYKTPTKMCPTILLCLYTHRVHISMSEN